jgi:hypothetical protein
MIPLQICKTSHFEICTHPDLQHMDSPCDLPFTLIEASLEGDEDTTCPDHGPIIVSSYRIRPGVNGECRTTTRQGLLDMAQKIKEQFNKLKVTVKAAAKDSRCLVIRVQTSVATVNLAGPFAGYRERQR